MGSNQSIVLNSETQEYTVDGIIYPRVTQILPKQDFFCDSKTLEAVRQDGIRNHSLIESYHETEDTHDIPYLEIYKRFLDEQEGLLGQFICNEKSMFSRRGFVGTPDLIFSKARIDLKRSFGVKKYHALQLAGYNILAKDNGMIDTNRWFILLINKEKNDYTLKPVYNPQAETIFLALLQKHKISEAIDNYFTTL